jgi:hypothetical protein
VLNRCCFESLKQVRDIDLRFFTIDKAISLYAPDASLLYLSFSSIFPQIIPVASTAKAHWPHGF